jgi:Ca2+-binding RTX toxin-like protein
MSTIPDLFQQAQLSEAAYANFIDSAGNLLTTDADVIAALRGRDFGESQAIAFVQSWRIVSQFSESGVSSNGFSATLIERLDANQQPTGQYTLAIRGSNDIRDFVGADLDLAVTGLARNQLVSMLNYVLRLKAGENGLTQQLTLDGAGLTSKFVSGAGPGIDPGQVVVSGHSLGGYLSQVYQRIFGSVGVYTYNSLGITNTNAAFFDEVTQLLGLPAGGFGSGSGENLLVPGEPAHFIGTIQGDPQIQVFSETSTTPINTIAAHRIGPLTDSLAIYNLFAGINPTFNTSDPAVGIGKITEILKAASNNAALSLEGALDSLRKLFKDPAAPDPAPTITNDRERFYQNLYSTDFQNRITAYSGVLSIEPLAGKDALSIEANAFSDIAYRYALRDLNPFAVIGEEAIYEQHNLTGELDLYDPATGLGLTWEYIADRAEMLKWKNLDYIADGQRTLRSTRTETIQYVDQTLKDAFGNDLTFTVAGRQLGSVSNAAKVIFGSEAPESLLGSDLAVGDHLYGGGGDDVLDGRGGNDYLEGGGGADILLAGEGDDVLVSGAGDDTLAGGAGRDVLDGGPGFDTYDYFSGDGPDTISDADGQGQIFYDGTLLNGGLSVGPNLWRSEDERFQFTLYAEDDGTQTLSVGGGGTFFIKNFVPGVLGITLEDALSPNVMPPAGGREILGLYAPQIFDNPSDLNNPPPDYQYISIVATAYPHDYLLLDELGNFVRDPSRPWTGGFQDLYGSDGGDQIVGSDFGNGLAGNAGDDHLIGGLSPDGAGGGEGDDFIEGGDFFDAPLEDWINVSAIFPEGEIRGASDDRLFGGAGNDVIFGSTAAELESLLDPATPSAGHKGDWVAGEMGDDRLYGSTGHDVLLGGGGEDSLIGGPGDDVLVGDDSFSTSHTTNPAAGGWMWRIDGGSSSADLQFFPISVMPWLDWSAAYYKRAGDDDALFGGAGNDILVGQLGNDTLFGETGNDVLSGWEGDDTLLGGEGDDIIAGDFGRYEQANDRLVGLTHAVPAGFLDINTGNSGEPEQSGSDYLDGGSGADVLYGEGGTDTVLGGTGDDALWGDAEYLPEELQGADYLDGGAGDDTLHGGHGDDTLIGSIGDDILDGGEGSDTYVFNQGDGIDFIEDGGWEGTDILVLRDYLQSDVSIDRGLDGRLTVIGTQGDAITIQRIASSEGSGIERIQFADGTALDHAAIERLPFAASSIGGEDWVAASEADDVINTFGMAGNRAGGFLLLDAGAGSDVVFGDSNAVVYGNEGDDQLFGGDVLIGGEGNDYLADGVTLFGGPGDDQLSDGALLVGGPGNDFLDGGFGASRYGVLVEDNGHDTIHDGAGLDEFALAEWYYPSLGIPDWEARLFDPDTEDTISINQGIALGLLPELPLIAPYDYAALEPLYAAGLIEFDALEIGLGVALDDLALSWETVRLISPLDGDLGPYVVLNVGITPDNVVSVVIPRSDDPLGAGIEEVHFADGTAVTLGELIALAPPAPDFDPAFVPIGGPVFVFEAGDGVRFIDDPGVTTIEFGSGITADMLTLGLGSLVIRVGDEGDAIHVLNFNPNDAFTSQIENVVFTDGTQLPYGELIGRGFDIFGTEDDDFLSGTSATDRLRGGAGSDFYFFYPQPGSDTIEDEAGDFDTVFLAGKATPDDITVMRAGDFVILDLSPTDRIAIRWQPEAGYQIEQVRFNGGMELDAATLESMVKPQNTAPTLAHAIPDQTAHEDEAFSFTVPMDTFLDTDTGDVLALQATIADEDPLPYWLVFDVTTQRFSGTPTNDDLGSFDVLVTATDAGGLSVDVVFTLMVANTNDAPYLVNALFDQFGNQNAPLEFVVSDTTFADVDAGDVLTFASTLADGSTLPEWLEFDTATRTFSGTPGEEDTGLYSIFVIASDAAGATASGAFELGISDAATTFASYHGTSCADLIHTGFYNDLVEAGNGDDTVLSSAGRDLILADKGDDRVYGGSGNDYLFGGEGRDHLFGEGGSDALFGERGDDYLYGGAGNNILDGGTGRDMLIAGSGNNVLIGGPGSDVLYGASAHDVFLFNRGDGEATLHLESAAIPENIDTISLGTGIAADDIVLHRKNNDLIVKVDESDDDDGAVNVVLKGWYETGGDRRTVTRLQLINERIEIYDFTALTSRFDAATDGRTRHWRAGPEMSDALLSTSDSEAIGGAPAYQYAMRGTLAYASVRAIQATLTDPLFGEGSQAVADPGGPALAPFLATGSNEENNRGEDFLALIGVSGTVTGLPPVIHERTDGVMTLLHSRRKGRHEDNGLDDENGLEALIERWFGRATDTLTALSRYLDDQDSRHSTHQGTGRNHYYADKDEIAACWRRTKVLLEAHLANQDPAAMTGGEGHGFSRVLGRFGGAQPIAPGEKLSRVSGHHLRRLEGLEEGLTRLSM